MRKSVSLNSYAMFQPRGPNLRRSCTSPWKKHNPNSIFLNSIWSETKKDENENLVVENFGMVKFRNLKKVEFSYIYFF